MAPRGPVGDEAFARDVGISWFAFCTPCGHPRKLLRSSSGAKSRRVSQVPASRPITSSPACASGSAATPPTAPSPTITTSAFLRLVAMTTPFQREHRIVISRFADHCWLVHALLVLGHRNADARIANHLPAHEVGISAVVGIAERPLDGMVAHETEERSGIRRKASRDVLFQVAQHRVLHGSGQLDKGRSLGRDRILVEGSEA